VNEQVDTAKATSAGVTKMRRSVSRTKGRKKFSRSKIKVHYSGVANVNQNTRWLLRCDDFAFVNHTRSRHRCVVGGNKRFCTEEIDLVLKQTFEMEILLRLSISYTVDK
jgi:hypothetical protein